MKNYDEFSKEELKIINQVLQKSKNNEFITNDELKVFNSYKKSLEDCIDNYERYWADKDLKDLSKLKKIFDKAYTIYEKIRKVHTFDIYKVCEYIMLEKDYNMGERTAETIAERVLGHLNGVSNTELQFAYEILEHSEHGRYAIKVVRELTTPINLRKWGYSWNRATEYTPFETAHDSTQLYDNREHYIYIHSKCTQHRWGETYWISTDCNNTLESLPVIKDFKNFDFKIGRFYKVICEDTIYFGKKKKYKMKIEETTEKEFMEQGFVNYAKRW